MMQELQDLTERDFLELYNDYVKTVLFPTKRELDRILGEWKDNSFWHKEGQLILPSPINQVQTRIKRAEAVVDKIKKQPRTFPEKLGYRSLRIMNDTVAGRIVVHFLSDLSLLHQLIVSSEYFDISDKNPPAVFLDEKCIEQLGFQKLEKREKDTGYCAIHYILRIKNYSISDHKPWFEIQLKTLAQHVWSELEHNLGYKPDSYLPSNSTRKQFQIISSHLNAIDQHFNLLSEEIYRKQSDMLPDNKSIINAENLPAVLSKIGIGCSKNELNGLQKILESRGIKYVGDLNDIATAKRLEIIRNTYRKCEGRIPNNFEVVANLAATKGIKDAQVSEAVETQINYNRTWNLLKESM